MEASDLALTIFPSLKQTQLNALLHFEALLKEWNAKVNLVSRKDIDCLFAHHIAPCLAMGAICQFAPNARVLDIGTGGGFPGLVLAIMYPEADFMLIDSIGKKINAVAAMADALALKNVRCKQIRAENLDGRYDYVASRAVTALPRFVQWTKGRIRRGKKGSHENGIFYLKGGDLSEDYAAFGKKSLQEYPLQEYLPADLVSDKVVLHLTGPGLF